MYRFLSTFLFLVLFLPFVVHAGVRINEVAWMGTAENHNHEWIELYNSGDEIDITGWMLETADGTPSIIFSTSTIVADSSFLLERSDDDTVSGVTADYIYTGALGNGGETLILKDANGGIVFELVGGLNWGLIGGDNETKETAQYIDDAWVTALGTPGAENEVAVSEGSEEIVELVESGEEIPDFEDIGEAQDEQEEQPEDDQEESEAESLQEVKDAPEPEAPVQERESDVSEEDNQESELAPIVDVVIVEIMYDLQGADSGREWIEVQNLDTVAADLSEWRLFENDVNHRLSSDDDLVLDSDERVTIVDSVDKFLEDNPSFVGKIFESVFSLSNEGEELILRNGDLVDINKMVYEGVEESGGHSLQFVDGAWHLGIPTPGERNIHEQFVINLLEEEEIEKDESIDTDESFKKEVFFENVVEGLEESFEDIVVLEQVSSLIQSNGVERDAIEERKMVVGTTSTTTVKLTEDNAKQLASVYEASRSDDSDLGVWVLALVGIMGIGIVGTLFVRAKKREDIIKDEEARSTQKIADEISIVE